MSAIFGPTEVLEMRVKNLEARLAAVEERLVELEVDGSMRRSATDDLVVSAQAVRPDRGWINLPASDPSWPAVRAGQRSLTISAIEAGLWPEQQEYETQTQFENRISRSLEIEIKTNPEFDAYVDAAGGRDPWTWAEGLADLAAKIDGEAQVVTIVRRSRDG